MSSFSHDGEDIPCFDMQEKTFGLGYITATATNHSLKQHVNGGRNESSFHTCENAVLRKRQIQGLYDAGTVCKSVWLPRKSSRDRWPSGYSVGSSPSLEKSRGDCMLVDLT